jgi:cadmium resistance protein CadD (predicted permease)
MPVWEPAFSSIAAFSATNTDDILILALFFSQVGVALKGWHIVTGQVAGFTALVAISLLRFALASSYRALMSACSGRSQAS